MVDPKDDGINHINIYSKGSTAIGRFLSNFADCHIHTEDGYFRTVEGYWYWLSTKHEPLRDFVGWQAKQVGRKQRGDDWNDSPEFQDKISKAIIIKILQDKWAQQELIKTVQLPLYHYYVYNSKVLMAHDGFWMLTLIDWIRQELVKGTLCEV